MRRRGPGVTFGRRQAVSGSGDHVRGSTSVGPTTESPQPVSHLSAWIHNVTESCVRRWGMTCIDCSEQGRTMVVGGTRMDHAGSSDGGAWG